MNGNMELWRRLSAPFLNGEIKTRPQAHRQLSYITARTVMNRLDDVLGPENWWDSYLPLEHSVLCTLTVRLPDGSTISKQDAGGYAGMTDQGDDDKSGYSDAFKRAAVKFGVGRYLYRDGVPDFAAREPVTPPREPGTDDVPEKPHADPPRRGKKQDGPWLVQALRTRSKDAVDWFDQYGQTHGFPRDENLWDESQVKEAISARKSIVP